MENFNDKYTIFSQNLILSSCYVWKNEIISKRMRKIKQCSQNASKCLRMRRAKVKKSCLIICNIVKYICFWWATRKKKIKNKKELKSFLRVSGRKKLLLNVITKIILAMLLGVSAIFSIVFFTYKPVYKVAINNID